MTTWLYYAPVSHLSAAIRAYSAKTGLPYPPRKDVPVVTIGQRQLDLMLTARASKSGMLTLFHGRSENRTRMAARRLVQRGLLTEPNFMGTNRMGNWRGKTVVSKRAGLYAYALTDLGRTCWLRVAK